MSTTGFPVPQDRDGNGCTAAMMRRIVAAHWEAGGVVDGMRVSGGTSMEYTVSPGVAVIPMGANRSQGYVEAYCEGGQVATTSNAGTTPRVDAVWVMAHDIIFGDADNLVTLGVTQGAPAVVPKAPSIPTRAALICDMQVPAGATSTAGAVTFGSYHDAVPYGASLGVLADVRDSTGERVSASNADWKTRAVATLSLPTNRVVEVRYDRTATTHDFNSTGSLVVDILVDGASSLMDEIAYSGAWETKGVSLITTLRAGTHVVSVRDGWHEGAAVDLISTKPGYPTANVGMRMMVVDRGVAR